MLWGFELVCVSMGFRLSGNHENGIGELRARRNRGQLMNIDVLVPFGVFSSEGYADRQNLVL